jgi:hypothetical protein
MAYNYLDLANEINRRLNEVELTSSNFTSATGYYSFIKDAINSSIRHIHQEEFEWPWQHREESETLVAGTTRYSYPTDAKTINIDSFRIKRDDTLNTATQKLKVLDYEEYLDKYVDYEYNSSTGIRTTPRFVSRTPSRELVLVPTPDKAYELVYEYYATGVDLSKFDDVPAIPEQYRYIIVDGAMYYVYQFRGDMQAANLGLQKFEQGIKQIRSININRTEYLRDTRVHY